MTIAQNREFVTGRELWQQYVIINGYAWKPSDAGLEKLSRILDLNKPYLRKHINAFLSA